ncbi:MAG TPA: hypothetical protein VGD80_22390 [Kofleriaceae bacterium]
MTDSNDPAAPAGATSPYLGLRSFSEADHELFHGRESETTALFHLVQRETLSVVFGMSGLGKSSLLRAGLFPRLRDAGLFPIVVRLAYDGGDLVEQIRSAIATEIAAHAVDAKPPVADRTLWEYFHRTPFWSARNRPLIPVVVIDQFEELFTLGRDAAARASLLTELADLVENRIPESVRRTGDADALPPSFEAPKAKVVLALREDFLARLEDLRPALPSIARGRFRLRPMDGDQAVRAVRHARTAHLVEPAVAERIVRFVAGAQGERRGDAALDAMTVEPALLSLVCRQLDDLRVARGEPAISADLLTGESSRILDDFYAASIAGLPARIIDHIEDHLLTPVGHRTTVALSSLEPIQGMGAAVAALVDRRILRIEERLGHAHVEVIHDVLTRVMAARRDRRREQAARRQRSRRRIAIFATAATSVTLVVGGVLYLGARHRLNEEAEQQRAAIADERRRNALEASNTLVAEASATLAHDEVWSAARLLGVAYGIAGEQPEPELAMLAGRFTALRSTLKVLQPTSGVTEIAFSGDGTTLVAGHQDGSVSIWSTGDWTSDWTPIRLAQDDAPDAAPSRPGEPSASPPRSHGALPGSPKRADDGGKATPAAALPRMTRPVRGLAVSHDGQYVAVLRGTQGTIWSTRSRAIRGSVVVGDDDQIRISNDGDWVIQTSTGYRPLADDTISHFDEGHYVRWPLPPTSISCLRSFAPTAVSEARPYMDLTRLAISGDGSTLARYRYHSSPPGGLRGGELTLFALGSNAASLATRCVRDQPGIPRLSINIDATAIAIEAYCAGATVPCEAHSLIYRRAPATNELQLGPAIAAPTFDARRSQLVVGGTASTRSLTTLDGSVVRTMESPCGNATRADLVDGRLAMIGACGKFIVASDDGKAIAGELPVAHDVLAISAAGRLVASVSRDGVIRVWRLETSRDHLVHAPASSLTDTPSASITPFTVGPTFSPGAMAISADGGQVIAGADDAPSVLPLAQRPRGQRRITLGVFDIAGTALKLLDAKLEHPPSTRDRSKHGVSHVELSPDERQILSVGRDSHARVWRRDGAPVLDLGNEDSEPIFLARYSPNGDRIGTTGSDHVCSWNAADGRRQSCVAREGARDLAFDTPESVLVGYEAGAVMRWNIATGAITTIGHHDGPVNAISVDREARWVASAGDDALRIWDLQSCGDTGCRELAHAADSHAFYLTRVVSALGHTLVVGVVRGGPAHVIDVADPGVDDVLPLASEAYDLDVSPGGRALLCEGNLVEEWDLVRRQLTGRLQLSTADFASSWCEARYAGDGRVVSRFSDGALTLWPATALAAGVVDPALLCTGSGTDGCVRRNITSVAYADNDRVVAYDGDAARLFAVASGELIAASPSTTFPVVVDGRVLVASHTGQFAAIDRAGNIRRVGRTRKSSAAMLAVDRGSGEAIWIDTELRYRLVNKALALGAEQGLTSTLAHGGLQALEYAPSGRWLLAARSDGSLTRFDEDGRQVASLALPENAYAHAIVPAIDGDGLLAIGDDAIAVWPPHGPPEVVAAASGSYGSAAAWDMAANTIISGTQSGLTRLDIASGRRAWTIENPFRELQYLTWVDLDRSQPKPTILAATPGRMGLFSFDDGHLIRNLSSTTYPQQDTIGSWFLPPRLLLTLGEGGNAVLWDTRTGTGLASQRNVRSIARGPGDQFAMVQLGDAKIMRVRGNTLLLDWELRCERARWSMFRAIAWFNGRIAAAGGDILGVDETAATRGDWICVWDAATATTVASWQSGQTDITRLAFSDDGSRLLAQSTDGTPRLWAVPAGTQIAEFGREGLLTTAFVSGKPYIITDDHTGTIRTYDARTGTPIAQSPGSPPWSTVVLSTIDTQSGSLAIVDDNGAAVMIDIRTGRRTRELPPNNKRPLAMALAPGGSAVAIASADQIRLWSSLSTAAAAPAMLDAAETPAMGFSPDARWLATAGVSAQPREGGSKSRREGELIIRRTMDGIPIIAFKTDVPLTAVAWSADGTRIVVGGSAGFVKTFDLSRETRDPATVRAILKTMSRQGSQVASPSPADSSPTQRRGHGLIDI